MTSKAMKAAAEFCDDWMHWSGDPTVAHESLATLLDQHTAKARADQREDCAYWVKCEFYRKSYMPELSDYISACLNAVEKSDD